MSLPVSTKEVNLIRNNPGCFGDWTVLELGVSFRKELYKPIRATCVQLLNGEWFQFESSRLVNRPGAINANLGLQYTQTNIFLAIKDPNDLILLRLGASNLNFNIVDSSVLGIPGAKRRKY